MEIGHFKNVHFWFFEKRIGVFSKKFTCYHKAVSKIFLCKILLLKNFYFQSKLFLENSRGCKKYQKYRAFLSKNVKTIIGVSFCVLKYFPYHNTKMITLDDKKYRVII